MRCWTLKFLKKKSFSSACKIWVWKKNQNFWKNEKKRRFFYFTFMALKWPKIIFFAWNWFHVKIQSILKLFGPGKIFHTSIFFGCRSDWNFQSFENFEISKFFKIFKKLKISSASTAKRNSRMKTLVWPRSFKILWTFVWN